jgi:uncharacterized protein YuzE
MAHKVMSSESLRQLNEAIPHLLRLPGANARIDYDQEADVLYLSLERPRQATETEFIEDQGLLLRYWGEELVGITVLDASQRSTPPTWRRRERAMGSN